MIKSAQTKPLKDPAPLYRRIRGAVNKPDPGLHAWLATIKREDWEALTWLVNNRFTPVDLYHHLKLTDSIEFVPQAEREFLEGCAQLAAEQYQKYFADVARMASALNTKGITPTLIKGAALISGGYYPRNGQRFIGDIDFLVQPGELDVAITALEQQGFKMKLSLPRPVEAYWRTKHDLPSMWHEEGFFWLECHLKPMDEALLHPAPFDAASMLEHSRSIKLAQGKVNIPCPEHLAVHSFYHTQLYDLCELAGVDSYRSMIDVATVVAHEGGSFDWSYVTELIASIHAQKSFALFVDRIAHCVDSRALDWPVDRSGIKYKKRIHAFFASRQKTGPLLAALVIYIRAVWHALSREGRAERRVLFKANPDEIRFSPVWRQLLIPSIWTKRVRYIGQMAGIGSK